MDDLERPALDPVEDLLSDERVENVSCGCDITVYLGIDGGQCVECALLSDRHCDPCCA